MSRLFTKAQTGFEEKRRCESRKASDFPAVNPGGTGAVAVDFGGKESLAVEVQDNLLPYLESEVDGGARNLGVCAAVHAVYF